MGHHSITYSVFLHGLVLYMSRVFRRTRLYNVGDMCVLFGVYSCVGASNGVWCVSGSFVTRLYVLLFMLTCMGYFIGGVAFCDLAHLVTLAKLVVGC